MLLNEKEKLHLADVKNLVTRGQQMLAVIFFLGAACFLLSDQKKKIILCGGILALMLIMLMVLVDFQTLFVQFHYLVFTNDLWLLNPATDTLIKMYPLNLFHDLVQRIIAHIGIAALMIATIGLYKSKSQKLSE